MSSHNLCFRAKIKKNNVCPCKPQFYIIKVGFKGGQIIQACFRDGNALSRCVGASNWRQIKRLLMNIYKRVCIERVRKKTIYGGSVGCVVRLETRKSRVQPPPRLVTFFRGD